MMEANSPLKDYLILNFLVVVWSFTAILGQLISIPALEIVFHRTLISTAALGLVFWVKKTPMRLHLMVMIKIIATGLLIGAHWMLFFWAAQVSTISVCLAGIATVSLWTAVLEPVVNKSRIKWYEVFLGLLVIFGLYVVFSFEFGYWLGLGMAVLSAFLCSCFTVINGRLTKKHSPYVITFYEMVGAFLFSVLFMPFYAFYLTDAGLNFWPKQMDWLWLLILSLVCTVFAFSVSVELMKRLTAFAVNLTVNLEPIYGIILALVIFGESEKMTPGFYIGTLIILAAVCLYPLIHYVRRRRATKSLLKA